MFILTAVFRNTGNKVRLRQYSRGIFAIIRAGGHIDIYAPLYKSESPTQVHNAYKGHNIHKPFKKTL